MPKFEPLKARSGYIALDISAFYYSNFEVEKPYSLAKNSQNTHTSCIYFVKNVSVITPVYINVVLRS